MFSEPRKPPLNLLMLRLLNAHMTLSEQDQRNYYRLEKGFEGELKFDELTDELQTDCFVLKGLLLEVGGNEFQIDTLIIFQGIIHLYDVKNYEGDYYLEDGKLYLLKGNIVKDPLAQLRRCETLFIKLLQELGFRIPVESRLVFISPEFTLMQAPKDYPIIYPTQVNRYMKKLNKMPGRLNKSHEMLTKQLLSLHKLVSDNMKLPPYQYEDLEKRIMCEVCYSLATEVNGGFIVCKKCGHRETVESAVLRGVRELVLLFPGIKITTNLVHEWCGIVKSKKTVRRILIKHYPSAGKTTYRYFIVE